MLVELLGMLKRVGQSTVQTTLVQSRERVVMLVELLDDLLRSLCTFVIILVL